MHLDDPAADASGPRVPAHMIAHLELFCHGSTRSAASMALEILHGTLVLLGRRARLERAEIATAAVQAEIERDHSGAHATEPSGVGGAAHQRSFFAARLAASPVASLNR